MKPRKLRRGFALASSLGVAAMSVSLLLGVGMAGTASAATIPAFPGQVGSPNASAPVPAFDTYPWWLPENTVTGADPISNTDLSEGSDTTLYVMQAISDLYAQAGISPFSCSIAATANSVCQQPTVSTPNPNNTQSDETDNFSGTQELQGTNDVGSGNGQSELCSSNPSAPAGTTVAYARSSKPVSTGTCSTGIELGFAKDAVVGVDFQTINPGLYGTPSGYLGQTDPQCSSNGAGFYPSYSASNGTVTCTKFPSAGIGPVADGWLPTDPTNCGTGGGPACTGTAFTNISNQGISGGTGATSPAYRLFCQHGPSAAPNTSQITDWGQLTNLSAANNGGTAQPVGDGAPIGVPVRIIAINSGSGTVSTFYNFAQSGIGTPASGEPATDCAGGVGSVSSSDVDVNAASGPDPDVNQGPPGTNFVQNPEVSLENDANQIGDFASANWPSDPADEATDIATSLYSMSFGVFGVNGNASTATIETGTVPSGDPTSFTAKTLQANGVTNTVARERANTYPMSRTLFNIYRTDTVNASTAGFLNWLCDSNSSISKGTDHVDGGNFDTDLTSTINGTYGFSRVSDLTQEVASTTPADNVAGGGVDGTCDAHLSIAAGGISAGSNTITLAAAPPSVVASGWSVQVPSGSNVAIPAGDTIASISGTTVTLTAAAVTGTSGGPTPTSLYFPGQAPVLQINTPGS
jgi:hypothetical protein